MNKLVLLFIVISLNFLYAKEFKNDLQYETSPYLLQHATNPVHWMAWGEKAFAKAKKQNKPIYLSIGYSTCHWCHVMAKESFTNKDIAKKLNKDFISIKVDREEYPQIDSYFQELYFKVNHKRVGWPLNVFLTSDKTPFFISGYLPAKKESYSEGLDTLLPKIAYKYHHDFKSIQDDIKKIRHANKAKKTSSSKISKQTLIKSLYKNYDSENSGFGNGRKFPEAARLSLMMDLGFLNQDKKLLKYSYDMLDNMALRGLYDHVEGGFYRYSTDSSWEIAHFEKMLYNQAELLPLYSRAYYKTGKKLYKDIVKETIAMLESKFLKDNVYYSASDTDSNGKEGDYFTFTQEEIKNALLNNPYKEEIYDALGFVVEGNFHSKVHLGFDGDSRPKGFNIFRKELLKIRDKKKYPFIDKKINTAWNSMMIEALYKASSIDIRYKKQADISLKALSDMMFDKGELYHQTILGKKAKQKGLLEDYSFFISALISAYEVDYDKDKLNFAIYLLSKAKEKFYKDGVWYLSDDNMNIKDSLVDKYYTSPVAKMIQNIIKLSALEESFEYEKLAILSLKNINSQLSLKQSDAPASATAYLMQQLNVVTLKSDKNNLVRNRLKIKKINYPYLLTKAINDNEYLSCVIRRCFSKDKNLDKAIISINNNTRRP